MKLKEILLGAMFGIESFIGLSMPVTKGYVHQTTLQYDCKKEGFTNNLIFEAYRKESDNASEFMTIREKNKKPFGVFIFEYDILAIDNNSDGKIDKIVNIYDMVFKKENVCHHIPK